MSASKLGKCASAGLRPVTPRRPSVHSTPLRSSCNPLLTVPRFQPSSCSARYGIPSKISSTVRAMNSRRAYPVSEPAVSRASFLTASKLNIIVKDHAQLPRVKFSAHLVFGESLKFAEILITCGHTEDSPYGYATCGTLLISVLGDYETGCQFGDVALALLEKPGMGARRASALNLIVPYLHVWRHPLSESI